MSTFGNMLATYRKRAQMNQEELSAIAKLHPSDLSKIERDIRKPPKIENLLSMIKALKLTASEATELLTLGNYPLSTFGNVEFDPTIYPETTEAMAQARLQGDRGFWPVWRLDVQGNINAVNLLGIWLWGGLTPEGDIDASQPLLGSNVFDLYIRPENFDRIAMPARKTDFWYTKIMVFKKLENILPTETVTAFREKITATETLRLIYEYGAMDLKEEWFYTLRINPIALAFNLTNEDTSIQLEVSVEQIRELGEHIGFIVTYQPLKYSIEVVNEVHRMLIAKHGKEGFVYTQNLGEAGERHRYPSFYPALFQDLLWYIVDENRVQQLLAGNITFKGKHFFDLVLSQELELVAGPAHEATALEALWYFFKLTSAYEDEGHPLHTQYQEMMHYLLTKPAFRTLVTWFWQKITPEKLGRSPKEGIPACEHRIKCRYSNFFDLWLESIPWFPRNHASTYHVVLVPKNDETTAALILMLLEDSVVELIGVTPIDHLKWGSAIVRTVREGMTKGAGDTNWEVGVAFRHNYQVIETELSQMNKPELEELTFELRLAVIGLLTRFTGSSTAHISDMLLNFMKLADHAHGILIKEYGQPMSEIEIHPFGEIKIAG